MSPVPVSVEVFPVPDFPSLGDLLVRHRRVRGMSQETLAERAAVSGQTVSDIETGVTGSPRPATLHRLATALGLGTDEHGQLIAASLPRPRRETERDETPAPAPASGPRSGGSFAAELRRLRDRAGMNRAELAGRAGLADKTLSNIEKGVTARVHGATAGALADALGLTGPARHRFMALAMGVETDPVLAPTPPPSPAHVHGRVHEYARLTALVARSRLVTVTGPAGVGKTTLADVALAGHGPALLRLELARVAAGTPAPSAIAAALGTDQEDVTALAGAIPADSVVLLDNLEHLVDAGPTVAGLLAARPDLRVVTTSRRVLGLAGEQVLTLDPLDLDAACTVFESAAVRVGGSAPTDADRALIEQICVRVDRLPLAIELAAARTTILGPQDILDQLARSTRVLRRPGADPADHHATMLEAVDWSLRLLSPDAARLIQTLALHQSPWPVRLIGAVHDSPSLLDSLEELAAAHLIVVQDAGATKRFSLLQTVHDVATEHLVAERDGLPRVDVARIREAHAAHLLDTVAAEAPRLIGPGQQQALATIDALAAHADAAISHLLDTGDSRATGLAASLWRYWQILGRFRHGATMIERCLPLGAGVSTMATAHYGAAVLHHLAANTETSVALAMTALDGYRDIGDAHGQGSVIALLGLNCLHGGDPAAALDWYERGLREVRAQEAPRAHATLLANIGPVYKALGELDRAIHSAEQAAIGFRRLDDAHGVALQLGNLAGWSGGSGDPERALDLLNDAQASFEELGDRGALATCHLIRAEIALDEGDLGTARDALATTEEALSPDDPWNAAMARALAADAALLAGQVREANTGAAVALADSEQVGYYEARIRSLLVLAATEAVQGHPAAVARCRTGLEACRLGDARTILSFAVIVDALRDGEALPSTGRLTPSASATIAARSAGRAVATSLDPADRVAIESLRAAALARCETGQPALP